MTRIIAIVICIFILPNLALAAPLVSGVSGSVNHGQNITISGSGFGVKVPAAPLWWDNMEGASNGSTTFMTGELSWVVSGTHAGMNKHYSQVVPRATLPNATEEAPLMHYRNVGYRNVGAPHVNSTKYMTGGHWQFANNSPQYSDSGYQDVGVTIDSGTANKNIWYVKYYYRTDPNWTILNSHANYKKGSPNFGDQQYDTPNCYWSSSHNDSEGGAVGDNINMSWDNCLGAGGNTNCRNARVESGNGKNSKDSWISTELLMNSPSGHYEIWSWDGDGAGDRGLYVDNDTYCANIKNNTRSFSVGGWFCTSPSSCAAAESEKRGHQENFRYFDDIYVDNTFSRVLLCNNSVYTSATVCEPQIPSVWSDGSLTARVNLGSLPNSGTAHLFVFDANNERNATGYPVTLSGSGDTTPPGAPTGLSVS